MIVKHPRIVDFVGATVQFPADNAPSKNWSIGLVFGLCQGGEVNNLMHTKKVKFSMQEKLSFMKDTAQGVAYLHSLDIIHRDLSSRNLLLTGSGRVKIADYGCARKMTTLEYQPSFISGSPPWMAPEQIMGKPLSLKADVWALGAILWEFMSEKMPYSDLPDDLYVLQSAIQGRGLAPLKAKSMAHLSPALAVQIQQMIRLLQVVTPAARPDAERASQIFAGIEAALNGPSVDPDDNRLPEEIYGAAQDYRVVRNLKSQLATRFTCARRQRSKAAVPHSNRIGDQFGTVTQPPPCMKN